MGVNDSLTKELDLAARITRAALERELQRMAAILETLDELTEGEVQT